jgi:hypothetical protein
MNKFLGSLFLIALLFSAAPVSAAVLNVSTSGTLQSTLNSAQPGDTVVLTASGMYQGVFVLPNKSGNVTLTTSASLPNRRINGKDPNDVALLPILQSTAGMSVLTIGDNWTVDGVKLNRNLNGSGEIISFKGTAIGGGSRNVVLRRILIDIPDPLEQRRAIFGNGTNVTLTQSHISGPWSSSQDSQCFVAWDGAGPYTITDNFLDCGSENVMFGGADPLTAGGTPSNILIENNYFTKRLSWKGLRRGVKNLLEFKNANHIIVRGNTFEHLWVDAQAGRAILFTPRNQGCTAPYTSVTDALFENNTIIDVPTAISILGYDDICPSQQTTGLVFKNNTINADEMAFLTLGEIGKLAIYGNNINVPTGKKLMYLSDEGTIAIPGGFRPSQYAIADLIWDNIAPTGYIHSPTVFGTGAFNTYTLAYSLTAPIAPQPIPPSVDPAITALQAGMAAANAKIDALTLDIANLMQQVFVIKQDNAASRQDIAALVARLDAMVLYLRAIK